MCCFLFGFFSILLACTYRYRDILKTKKIKEKKEKKGTEMDDIEWEEDLEVEHFNEIYKENMDNIDNNYEDYFDDKSLENLKEAKFISRKTFDSVTS